MLYKRNINSLKITLILIFLTIFTSFAEEGKKWHLIMDEDEPILLEEVDFIIESENDFDKLIVVDKNGDTYNNISKISFKELEIAGISSVRPDNQEIKISGNKIHIAFVENHKDMPVFIYDLTGHSLFHRIIKGGNIEIEIGFLRGGVYILDVGGRCVKFRKQ